MSSGGNNPRPDLETDGDWEPSTRGRLRCEGTAKNGDRAGKRCGSYALLGQKRCRKHGGRRAHVAKSRYRFKSASLNAILDLNLNDEDYLSCRDELALMRTALIGGVRKMVPDGKDLDELSLHEVELLEKWTAGVAKIAETTNRIERGLRMHVTVDTLVRTIADISQIVLDVASPEVAAEILDRLERVAVPVRDDGDDDTTGDGDGEVPEADTAG